MEQRAVDSLQLKLGIFILQTVFFEIPIINLDIGGLYSAADMGDGTIGNIYMQLIKLQ